MVMPFWEVLVNEQRATEPGLAGRLSEITGVQIGLRSEVVMWTDGPTVRQMETLLAEHLAPVEPRVTCRRTSSASAWAARAIAVHGVFSVDDSALRDLPRPDWLRLAPSHRLAIDVVQQAVDDTPYPNRPDSADHEAPIRRLLSAADNDKTRLAELLIASVVDSSLNRRSAPPNPTVTIYLNRRGRPFYCTKCGKGRSTKWFAVVGHDWNKVYCASHF